MISSSKPLNSSSFRDFFKLGSEIISAVTPASHQILHIKRLSADNDHSVVVFIYYMLNDVLSSLSLKSQLVQNQNGLTRAKCVLIQLFNCRRDRLKFVKRRPLIRMPRWFIDQRCSHFTTLNGLHSSQARKSTAHFTQFFTFGFASTFSLPKRNANESENSRYRADSLNPSGPFLRLWSREPQHSQKTKNGQCVSGRHDECRERCHFGVTTHASSPVYVRAAKCPPPIQTSARSLQGGSRERLNRETNHKETLP